MKAKTRMLAAGMLLCASAVPVAADSLSQSFEAPVLGRTVRGSATTVFSVSTGGTVTRLSGNAIRLATDSVRTPTITLNCNSWDSSCANRYMRIRITPASTTGTARITRLRVGSLSGGQYYGNRPVDAAALDFILYPLSRSTASFSLGMDVTLAGGAPSGEHDFGYVVSVQLL